MTRANLGSRRQQRAIRFNHRIDPASGMIELWGKLDPLRGLGFLNRLKARMSELFAEQDARRMPVRSGREDTRTCRHSPCSTCASAAAGELADPR